MTERVDYKCFDCGCGEFVLAFDEDVEIEKKVRVQKIHLRPEQITIICKGCNRAISDGFYWEKS